MNFYSSLKVLEQASYQIAITTVIAVDLTISVSSLVTLTVVVIIAIEFQAFLSKTSPA